MRTLRIRGRRVEFRDYTCVVCLKSVRDSVVIERTIFYGRSSILLSLAVPLCYEHYRQATMISPAQVRVRLLGLWGGIVLGIAAASGLLYYWWLNSLGALWYNLLLALAVGGSLSVTWWAVAVFWIMPLFAFPQTKAVLNSVRISRYDPVRDILELTFQNDTAAELTARQNLDSLVREQAGWRIYQITARIQDDDIRLVGQLKTRVLLDHAPSIAEARSLLQPEIDRLLIQQLGEDTFYEISNISVEKTDQG